jgi:hypothetical protein
MFLINGIALPNGYQVNHNTMNYLVCWGRLIVVQFCRPPTELNFYTQLISNCIRVIWIYTRSVLIYFLNISMHMINKNALTKSTLKMTLNPTAHNDDYDGTL